MLHFVHKPKMPRGDAAVKNESWWKEQGVSTADGRWTLCSIGKLGSTRPQLSYFYEQSKGARTVTTKKLLWFEWLPPIGERKKDTPATETTAPSSPDLLIVPNSIWISNLTEPDQFPYTRATNERTTANRRGKHRLRDHHVRVSKLETDDQTWATITRT